MKFINWVDAYIVVYLRMWSTLKTRTKISIVGCLFGMLLAGFIGPAATLVLLVAGLLVLPALNHDIKSAIDRERTTKRK